MESHEKRVATTGETRGLELVTLEMQTSNGKTWLVYCTLAPSILNILYQVMGDIKMITELATSLKRLKKWLRKWFGSSKILMMNQISIFFIQETAPCPRGNGSSRTWTTYSRTSAASAGTSGSCSSWWSPMHSSSRLCTSPRSSWRWCRLSTGATCLNWGIWPLKIGKKTFDFTTERKTVLNISKVCEGWSLPVST